MSASDRFVGINILLMFNGNALYRDSKWIRYPNVFFGLGFVAHVCFYHYLRIHALFRSGSDRLYHIANLMFITLTAVQQIYIFYKRETLKVLLESFLKNISDKDQDKLQRFGITSLIAFPIYIIWNNVKNVTFAEAWRDYGLKQIYQMTEHYIFTIWPFTTSCFLMFFYFIVYFSEVSYYRHLVCSRHNKTFNVQTEIVNRRMTVDHVSKFNREFSLFPFLWLLNMFVNASGIIILIVKGGDKNLFIAEFVFFFEWILISYGSLCTFWYFNSKLKDKAHQAAQLILTTPKLSYDATNAIMKLRFIDELEQNAEVSLTCFHLFEIQPELMLTFASSVVTFTVLSTQIF